MNLLNMNPSVQISVIRAGLNAKEAEKLVANYNLNLLDLATMLRLSPRSLLDRARRKYKLNSVASERLFRLARIANHASYIFGDSISAGNWLSRPHTALNCATPLSMLDTSYGGKEVERILCSIEYGLPV